VTKSFTKCCENSQKISACEASAETWGLRVSDYRQDLPLGVCLAVAFTSPESRSAAYRVEAFVSTMKSRTQAMERTNSAVTRQIVAMGANEFEIGLYKPEGAGNGEPPMIPRTWDRKLS